MLTGMSQRPAATIADALGTLLQRRFRAGLYSTLTDGVDAAIDATSYPVISGVARLGAVTAAALGPEIGLDRSIVSRRAARLVEAGLLQTSVDPNDARATLLSLTTVGQRVVAALRDRLVVALEAHLEGWTAAEKREFATLLARFVAPGSL